MNAITRRIFSILVFLSGIALLPSYCQTDSVRIKYTGADTLIDNIRLFDSDELLEISLKFDITKYKRKKQDKEYLDAILTCYTTPIDSITRTLKVKPRGNTRLSICDFPPLLLNFKTQDSVEGEFSTIDKIKMVTHCEPGGEEYLLKEFLIYKLYNVLTEYSFRVRLLRVNYINTFKKSKTVREFAFVIEPVEILGDRIKGIQLTIPNVTQKNIEPGVMDRLAIFNYMIGNTDWSVPILHNVAVMSQGNSGRPDMGIIIPYDFDYSGLVNTDYAIPFDGLELKSVLDRRYLGVCRSEEIFIEHLKEFKDRKDELYKVINEFPYLNPKIKKEMIMYLEGFYKDFDKRNTIVFKLRNECLDF